MDALRKGSHSDRANAWRARIKDEAYGKVVASPLMHRCADGGNAPRAVFGGFWHFVNEFPAIIRETYAHVPAGVANDIRRHFLRESAPIVSAMLDEMADDESAHRALWIRSSRCVGLTENQLHEWRVLPEIKALTEAIRSERHLSRRLLYFVAVEIIAENVSRYLSEAPRFVEALGDEGMQWFTVHRVYEDEATTHEAMAYDLAMAVKRVAHEAIDENSINADVQRCVDWFIAAAIACVREFISDAASR